jgi:hypothetical protein
MERHAVVYRSWNWLPAVLELGTLDRTFIAQQIPHRLPFEGTGSGDDSALFLVVTKRSRGVRRREEAAKRARVYSGLHY